MKVDAKGRIVLPKEFRDRFGIDPGSEVVVRETDGRLVVEPPDDPDEIVSDLERLIATGADERGRETYSDLDPIARDHADAIREGADECTQQ